MPIEIVFNPFEHSNASRPSMPGVQSARLLEPLALLWIFAAYQFGLGRDFAFGLLFRSRS